MKNDYEVKLYMSERRKGVSQKVAAARAGMSERTARKYEQAGKLPSQLKRPHEWQTWLILILSHDVSPLPRA